MHTRSTTALLYVSVISNLVLAFMMIVKLQMTPAEVYNKVSSLSTQISMSLQTVEMHVGEVSKNVGDISTEMERRGEWMRSIDDELANRTKDRIYRSEVKRWVRQAKELNPSLDLPDIDAIQKPM